MRVFEGPLWVLILLSGLSVAVYYQFEKFLWKNSTIVSPFWAVFGLFLLQPIRVEEIPLHFRSRSIFALAIILVVLFSSLFASGVVTQMISPQYEPEIKNDEDIANHGLIKLTLDDGVFALYDRDVSLFDVILSVYSYIRILAKNIFLILLANGRNQQFV